MARRCEITLKSGSTTVKLNKLLCMTFCKQLIKAKGNVIGVISGIKLTVIGSPVSKTTTEI